MYAPSTLRFDKEVVLAAVTNHGGAIRYTSEALRGDKEVLLKAVVSDGIKTPPRFAPVTGTPWGRTPVLTVSSPALQADPLLVRLTAIETRAKRRWHLLKLKWMLRNFAWWWAEHIGKTEYEARFNAAGEAVLVGAGARAAKRDFATMMA